MMTDTIDFQNVELNIGEVCRDKIFSSFKNSATEFSYHARANELELFDKYDIKHRWLDFASYDEFLKFDFENIQFCQIPLNIAITFHGDLINEIGKIIDSGIKHPNLAAGAKLRICVGYNDKDDFIIAKLDPLMAKISSEKGYENISIAILKPRLLEIVESYSYILEKHPDIARHLHIQPSEPLNKIETALLFQIKYSGPSMKNCTISCLRAADSINQCSFFTALEILRSLGFKNVPGVFFISCPTCTRTRIDVIGLAKKIYQAAIATEAQLKIAVMGCEVNGPGESSHADIGVAGGNNSAVIFEHGKIVERVNPDEIERKLLERIHNHASLT